MGLSRRFQNLIMENCFDGAKSLHCVDLARQLFNNKPQPSKIRDGGSTCQKLAADSGKQNNAQVASPSDIERIRLPRPLFTYESALNQAGKINCFPLLEHTMLWADHMERTFLFDADTHRMEVVPNLHSPKRMPFSLFVPNADADYADDQYSYGSSLFVMERIPRPEVRCSMQGSNPFEAFVYRKPTRDSYHKSWQCQIIPPPPYIHEPKYFHSHSCPEITSFTVLGVGGDSHVCISVESVGTYCLDTASYKWSKVGEWTLPFRGRVLYVPEFKLWFGFTTETSHLAAADLSAMESQPQLVDSWKELHIPEEWKECKDPQLVNLGSGRFCIARFFRTMILNDDPESGIDQNVAVLTGVELLQHVQDGNGGSGKVQFQMIPHKSSCHISNDVIIDSMF